jgi:hypothetical protein
MDKGAGDIIHVHVYDPGNSLFGSKKSDRAEIHTYRCGRASECSAYAQGNCILVGNPFGPRCFGRKSISEGPTRRARSFRDFIAKGEAQEKYRALKTQPNKIFKVGDCYVMPYPHINFGDTAPFKEKASLFVAGFPCIENPTEDDISKIYTHKPMALMGGEIKDYQSKVVPQIVKHMHDDFPELYKKLISVHPEAAKLVEEFDYTGKKAILSTLSPGKMAIGSNIWEWDGEYLHGPGSHMIFGPADPVAVRVTPSPDAVVEITNTDMVNENTNVID